jgi:GTPase SAR1 family protein
MDKIKLLIVIVTIIVNGTNCDTDCDCKSIKELQEFMQKEIFQNKFEISKMNSRLRRLEASKRHLTGTNNKASSQGNLLLPLFHCNIKILSAMIHVFVCPRDYSN